MCATSPPHTHTFLLTLHPPYLPGAASPLSAAINPMTRTIAHFTGPAFRPYCGRCDRSFRHSTAQAQHIQASSLHNLCAVCSYDGLSWQDLLEHYDRTKHMQVCWGCNDGEGDVWTPGSRGYRHHRETYNVCPHCDQHFDNENNLFHVSSCPCPPRRLDSGEFQKH